MITVTINKKTHTGEKSISIKDGRVVIDGKDVTEQEKILSIVIHGNVEKMEVDVCRCVNVYGNANGVSTSTGNVWVKGDVTGNVSTLSGDVDCEGSMSGSISTVSGDVDCGGDVSVDVSTMTSW